MKIACVGEAMVELALTASGTTAQVGFAGDTLNTAIYLKRAAPQLEVSYVTRLGTDSFSDGLRGFIAAEGISTDDIETSETRRVGLYAITTDADGERSFSYWRDSSAAREMFQFGDQIDFSVLAKFDLIYLSAITLAIWPDAVRLEFYKWAAGYRAAGGQIAFDSNYRPALWISSEIARDRIRQCWEMTDIAMPSVDDEMEAFGDNSVEQVVARLKNSGVLRGALKCGEGGPESLGDPVKQEYPAAETVVDTTAAGDSFNGGYLAALLTGADQKAALMAGHMLARKVVGTKGAIIPKDVDI